MMFGPWGNDDRAESAAVRESDRGRDVTVIPDEIGMAVLTPVMHAPRHPSEVKPGMP